MALLSCTVEELFHYSCKSDLWICVTILDLLQGSPEGLTDKYAFSLSHGSCMKLLAIQMYPEQFLQFNAAV